MQDRFSSCLAAATLLCAIAGWSASALATDVTRAGPAVNVTGDGGPVKAAGASVTVVGSATTVKAAGAIVDIGVTATGDVDAAGAQININGVISGNVHAAGATLDVRGQVTGDVDLAGAVINSNVQTQGKMRAGAASLTVGPASEIHGSLQAGGAVVSISGHIGGKVEALGGLLTFDAQADGPVELSGDRIVVGSNARVAGDLTIRSRHDPKIESGAVISGTVNTIAPPTWWQVTPWMWMLAIGAAIAAGTVLTGIVLLLFGGRVFMAATEHVRHRPLSSFLFGVLALVVIPFIGALLVATVVGITIGLAVFLMLPLLIIGGHAVAAAGIASGLLVRRNGEIGALLGFVMLVAGAILLVAIGLIPWVGPALVGIAIILGTGAFVRTLGARIRRADVRPAV
jgi:cytoskeletal protein CcmA (bactofilin family)